jgi:hypothetical protein
VRSLRYLLVLVVALELAVWECFFVAARPFGVALPVSAVVAVIGNVVLGLVGARVLERPVGAAIPGLVWLGPALAFGSSGIGGDRVVTSGWRGIAFLVAGAAAAAGVAGVTSAGRPRTTPEAHLRR